MASARRRSGTDRDSPRARAVSEAERRRPAQRADGSAHRRLLRPTASSRLVDTVPAFAERWKVLRTSPVQAQVEEWARFYGRRWPELLHRQREAYASRGASWRHVAESRVFPRLAADWPRIISIHRTLRSVIPGVDARVRERLGVRARATHVLHVGIGCGAGWASTYGGGPAVLYGLENAAELGWTGRGRLTSLVAHELAHVLHSQLRDDAGRPGLETLRGPYGQLYSEGFATYVERGVVGSPNRRATDRDRGWSAWCREHERELASRYLRTVRAHSSVRGFFGSWYRIGGHIETGYWLGAEVVGRLAETRPLPAIATLPTGSIRSLFRKELDSLATGKGSARPERPPR